MSSLDGVDLDLQLAVCRRLVGDSCPYQRHVRPLTLVDLAADAQTRVDRRRRGGVQRLRGHVRRRRSRPRSPRSARRGVEHVLWLTLRAERQSYLHMNDDLRDAATRHPELTVVDWNLYSRSHPDWFQDDGLHLGYDGAIAMATLVHRRSTTLGLVAAPRAERSRSRRRRCRPASVGRPLPRPADRRRAARAVTWSRARARCRPASGCCRDGTLLRARRAPPAA